MLKIFLFSIPIIIWSAIEVPVVKKDLGRKGMITYLNIKIPSIYDIWVGGK